MKVLILAVAAVSIMGCQGKGTGAVKPQQQVAVADENQNNSIQPNSVNVNQSAQKKMLTLADINYGELKVVVKSIDRMVKQDTHHPSFEIISNNPKSKIQCVFRVVSYDAPYVGMKLHRFSNAYLTDEGALVISGKISHSRSALRESADFICQAQQNIKLNMLQLPVEKFISMFSDALEIEIQN
ncbi:MAG: hypothetical protein IPM57_10665 [Oligoflexia bacterium]|nr:hypothetical protein [Oligoflexia bacterium]